MTTTRLTDEQWTKVYAFLQSTKHANDYGEANMRRHIHAVAWVLRTGAQWRALPAEYGKWNSVFKRFGKLARHYVAFVHLAAVFIWLR